MWATISRHDFSQARRLFAAAFISGESNFPTSAAVALHASATRRTSGPSAGCAWRSCRPRGCRSPRNRRPGGATWRAPSCPRRPPGSSDGRSRRTSSRSPNTPSGSLRGSCRARGPRPRPGLRGPRPMPDRRRAPRTPSSSRRSMMRLLCGFEQAGRFPDRASRDGTPPAGHADGGSRLASLGPLAGDCREIGADPGRWLRGPRRGPRRGSRRRRRPG